MIRSLTIKGFLGIQALQLDVGPGGALIEGGNGRGKSSVMKAIKAALDGAGIAPAAVRKGADAAEILIDLEHDTVRRRISAAGNTSLTVEDENGSRRKAPQTFLTHLLGLAMIDPLDLWLAPAKERRAMILRAVPCRATPELLELHVPEEVRSATWTDALGPEGFAQHGLDVVARARSLFEGRRLAAGRLVKERQAAASAASLDATKAATAAEAHAGAPTKADATAALLDATSAKNEVDGRAAAGARSQAFLEGRQVLIAKLRADAAAVRQAAPVAPTAEEQEAALSVLHEAREAEETARGLLGQQDKIVADLEEQLRRAKARHHELAVVVTRRAEETAAAGGMLAALEQKEKAAHEAFEKAAEIDERATSEETAVKLLDVSAPSPEEVAAAHERVRAAEAAVRRAHEAERAHEAATKAAEAVDAACKLADAAAHLHAALDRACKALANEVPRALLADAAGALQGLTIEGDTIFVQDAHGTLVDVDQLNTAAQMRFALDVAKRLNAKSKIVLVDGLERIDDDQRAAFVAHAIEGGFQLFATRVTGGPLQVSPIGGAS